MTEEKKPWQVKHGVNTGLNGKTIRLEDWAAHLSLSLPVTSFLDS